MSQGLEIFRPNGSLAFSSSNRLTRVLWSGLWTDSSIALQTWTTVLPGSYPSDIWGIVIPLYPVDVEAYYAGAPGFVETDPLNYPGQIYISCVKTTDFPHRLIYGVY